MIHPFVEGYMNKEAGLGDLKDYIMEAAQSAGDWAKKNPEDALVAGGAVAGAGYGAATAESGNRLRDALLGGALGTGGAAGGILAGKALRKSPPKVPEIALRGNTPEALLQYLKQIQGRMAGQPFETGE